ncbi:hypothetical protein ACFL43_02900 [Thermodesulfobacteriota bacterium]
MNRKNQIRNEYAEFINSWHWEWFTTLTFPEHIDYSKNRVEKLLKQWIRKLCTQEGIQVACYFVISYKNSHPHIHLLMLGYGKKQGRVKTLIDVKRGRWVDEWRDGPRRLRADIQLPTENIRVSDYLAGHLNKYGTNADIDYYNLELLNKMRQRGLNRKYVCASVMSA